MASATKEANGKDMEQTLTGPTLVGDYYDMLSSSSMLERCATGAVIGWCSGYLLARVVRVAAALFGIFLLVAGGLKQAGATDLDWASGAARLAAVASALTAGVGRYAGDVGAARRLMSGSAAPFSSGMLVGFLLGVAAS